MAPASPLLALLGDGDDLDRVETALRASVETDDADLTEIASHLILAGGKRLRPACTVAAARTAGALTSDDVVLGGVAVELVHLGSLYHDDVMDEADTRRGIESVNARWGNLKAILAGDFLLARASEIAASLGTEVAGLLARTIGQLCEGEVAQLRHAFDREPHRGRPTSARSTARRRRCSRPRAASAASSADLPRPTVDALTECGQAFGMAFQIVDDVLDLTATEAELGKPAGPRPGRGRLHAARDPHAGRGRAGGRRAGRPAGPARSTAPSWTRPSPSCARAAASTPPSTPPGPTPTGPGRRLGS